MAEPSVIGAYLGDLGGRLRAHGWRRRRRILAEAREHLIDAARSGLEDGMDPIEAQQHAVARFGSPDQVAAAVGPAPLVRRALLPLLAALAGVTFLAGVIYSFGQQGLRREANDPQLPIAKDIAARLSGGSLPTDVATGPPVDLSRDPRLHVSVFDATGRPLVSTALLDGRQAQPPPGVLSFARRHGVDEVTWQPRPGVRIAAVVVRWGTTARGGTVLVGRSLRAVERDETALLHDVTAGWLTTLAVAGAAILGWTWRRRPPTAAGVLIPA